MQQPDSDLDLSFTSLTTDRLSFNDSSSISSSSSAAAVPHRRDNPNWLAVRAAASLSSDCTLRLRHLKLLRLVGSGNLGRVFLCRLRHYDGAEFALKVVDRDALTSKKLSHVQTEAQILASLDHPFLPTLYAHLEVSHYTCLLMDYCSNGDLHSLLRKQPRNRFPVQAVRFFAAEVLLALEYLHAQGIVYRDLKPENILIRDDGHIMLSDFDLCFFSDVSPQLKTRTRSGPSGRGWFRNRPVEERLTEFIAEPTTAFSKSCVGTHEYLAPELVSGNGHGNGVDWWAFGVLIYELLHGTTPFKGGSKESTLRNIASTKGVRFSTDHAVEDPGMAEARDLIARLLVKDPRRRLGCVSGATDLKRHPFFSRIKWPLIRAYQPPEVHGLAVRRSKAHVRRVPSPRKSRRCLWRRLRNLIRMKKYSSLNPNANYYSYVTYKH